MMPERFIIISVVFLVVLGFVVGAVAALPDPYFSDPGTSHQINHLYPSGKIYAYEYGKDVTNAGDAGDVYFTVYTDHDPLSSLVFPMEAGESVTAWSYYYGSPPFGMDRGYWTVRAATALDANISNNYLYIERWTPPPSGASIQVILPNGGENWASGETHTITWTTTGLEGYHVSISLYRWYDEFGSWVKHSDLVSNILATDNSYEWTVPELPAPADYKIRIRLSEDDYHHLPLDYSDNAFTAYGSDISPPLGVSALHNSSFASSYIRWDWTEPADPDFAHVLVWVDGKKLDGVFTFGWCNMSGLSPDTEHTISTKTVDTVGNINKTWVNHTARTASSSVPLPKTMTGVFRSGQWILDYGMDGTVNRRFNYGLAADTPLAGDLNNDGTMDIGVFRSGQWILDYGMDGIVDRRFNYGLAADTPLAGDLNNDGTMDIGVFRSGQWILDYGMNGIVDRRFSYGLATDTPLAGDFNNDGTMDIGVFRSGQWILDYGMNGIVDRRFSYGLATDTPLAGDFNNDGTMDIGVFRHGQWILDYGMNGIVDRRFNYGLPTDIPIIGI